MKREKSRRLLVRNVTRLLALVFVGLQEVPLAAPSPQDALPLMLQFVRASGVAQLLAADEQVLYTGSISSSKAAVKQQ